ncbi:MAG: hypothetical protein HY716_04820 [Planctomycetes bacterium]|nr:hypothetical protein [Planctomycetota bacterium]
MRWLKTLAGASVLVLALAGLGHAGGTLTPVNSAGKVDFEIVTGSTLFVNSEAGAMTPIPLAHAVGAATGALLTIGSRGKERASDAPAAREIILEEMVGRQE